jgi:hypothetical protein
MKNVPSVSVDEPAILIRINKTYHPGMTSQELYEATRGCWVMSLRSCERAEIALAVNSGVVLEVFQIDSWHPGGTTPYVTRRLRDDLDRRLEFIGQVALDVLRNKYRGKSVAHYFKRGEANPIKYLNLEHH